ncbi:DegT/DnrJ/EryC1/StrS family aminotransferase [bacterium]|nr:DegT/DnrJ/EryC1/StrS family aminotransferase [bacterium]
MIPFFDFKSELKEIRPQLEQAFARVFDRGYFILGPELDEFEQKFASYIGSGYAIGTANGTDAIEIALRACGIGQGDEVITAPNTAVPTVSAITATGAVPVFADIKADTYLIDPKSIEQSITAKTKAIIPVHLYGQCSDMDTINAIAAENNIIVIEDCAQAHGAMYKGKKAGSFGAVSAFSFYPTKNLGGYGDGGMIIANNHKIAQICRQLRNYGFVDRYKTVRNGLNSRLDEIQCAFLIVKLDYLDKYNEKRNELAEYYTERLSDISGLELPKIADERSHVFHLYVISTDKRDNLQDYLAQLGVGTLIHYPIPIHLQQAYGYLGYKKGQFPNAEKSCSRILSLPLYPSLARSSQDIVIESIRKFFNA